MESDPNFSAHENAKTSKAMSGSLSNFPCHCLGLMKT